MDFNFKTYYSISTIYGYAASVKEMISFISSLPIQERMKHSGSYLYSHKSEKKIIGIIKVNDLTGVVSVSNFYRYNFSIK